MDSVNLYQYVFNNPLRYTDPDGQFAAILIPFLVWGAELALPALSACVTPIIYGVITGTVAYGSYKIAQALNKNTEVYVPDRPLPLNEHGVIIPDTDAPHSQLGTGTGRKGKYPQAREFDKNGKPVRDIDFTDHDRPHDHTNPHQHRREENATGGTRTREDGEPLPGWKY